MLGHGKLREAGWLFRKSLCNCVGFFKGPLKALQNENVRVRGTRMQIQEVSAANLSALNTRSNLHEDLEQESGCKCLSHVQKQILPCLQ